MSQIPNSKAPGCAVASAVLLFIGFLVIAMMIFSAIDNEEPSFVAVIFTFVFFVYALVVLVLVPWKVYQAAHVDDQQAAALLALPPSDATILSCDLEDGADFRNYTRLKLDFSPAWRLTLMSVLVIPMTIFFIFINYGDIISGTIDWLFFVLANAIFGMFYFLLISLFLQIVMVGKTTVLVSSAKVRPGDYFKAVIYQSGNYQIDRLEVDLELRENYLLSEGESYKTLNTSTILMQENLAARDKAPMLHFSAQIPTEALPASKRLGTETVWYIRIKLTSSRRPTRTQYFRMDVVELQSS